MRRILLIYNPVAGKKHNLKHHFSNVNGFKEDEILFEETKAPAHATQLAAQYKDDVDIVAAIGGDGTVNEIGAGLVNSTTSMAIIPNGSGNGLARELRIPMNKRQAFHFLLNSGQLKIDTLKVNDLPCMNVAGVGFDADVAHLFEQMESRGFSTYIKATLKLYQKFRPLALKLEVDHKIVKQDVFLCSFANSRQFGNNAFIAPHAKLDDGKMHITLIKPFPWYYAPILAIRLFTKTIHKSRYYQGYSSDRCVIALTSKIKMHIDGEPILVQGPVSLQVLPQSLNVVGSPICVSSIR